ncbi:hypothetical protein Pint_03032 [Pistacia integerrima]|uniref:Uncharacterized protein n=1 Tax=Pistacia integerrima TaxID=434235 RepID=A0ACC0ZMD3_9ROSI|nr:hypothetical protein Pint_03032 [Pistacia integerrima]
MGLKVMFKPLVLGLSFWPGPPLGSTLVEKLGPTIFWATIRLNVGGEAWTNHLLGAHAHIFCGISMGLKVMFKPLVLGLSFSPWPPLGSTLVEKLGPTIFWVLMPIYFAKIGLLIDFFVIPFKHYFIVSCIVFTSAIGKFAEAFLSSICCQMPKRDAILLGLIVTFQGILKLGLFRLMRDKKRLDKGSFVIMCILMVLKTCIVTPIVRRLYDPSRWMQFMVEER